MSNTHVLILAVVGEQDYAPIDWFNSPLLEPFNDGTRSQCFHVTIIDDDLFELTESFTLMVTLVNDTQPVRISPNVATIEIVDNDGKSHLVRVAVNCTITMDFQHKMSTSLVKAWEFYPPSPAHTLI